jgi:hypothetical protein
MAYSLASINQSIDLEAISHEADKSDVVGFPLKVLEFGLSVEVLPHEGPQLLGVLKGAWNLD